MSPKEKIEKFKCPYCMAAIGRRCVNKDGTPLKKNDGEFQSHTARRVASEGPPPFIWTNWPNGRLKV